MKKKFLVLYAVFFIFAAFSLFEIYSSFAVVGKKVENGQDDTDYEKIKRAIEIASSKSSLELGSDISSPSALLENKILKVSILNGSGISGGAERIKKELEKMENIVIENIGNYTATSSTIVQMKTKVAESIASAILNIVEKNFGKAQKEDLEDKEDIDDIIIILGSQ